MSEQRIVFGQEVTVERVRADVVAIGDGYVVTVQIILDNDDVLVAHTIARPHATLNEIVDYVVPEAVQWTSAWITDHAYAEATAS